MANLTPTPEQKHLIDLAATGCRSLAVNAFAGTGKTSTLAMIAEAWPGRSVLYLAFNKSIADDCKGTMPAKVEARTTHSLAYTAMRPSRARLDARLNGGWVAERYGLSEVRLARDKSISAAQLGYHVLSALTRFLHSADDAPGSQHVPAVETIFGGKDKVPGEVEHVLRQMAGGIQKSAFSVMKKLWDEQCDPGSNVPITHDTYLKRWALTRPQLNYDLVMFDEAQDANPVIIDVIQRQTRPAVVWVGDRHQQIYSWRGAVDALNRVKVGSTGYLTKSWRFGPAVADLANPILRALGERRSLVGAGDGVSRKGDRAILCRTNARALAEFMEHLGPDVELVGGKELLQLVKDVQALQRGNPRGAFALFADYEQLVEHSKTPEGGDLAALVKAVEEYGISDIIKALEGSERKPGRASLTISTIHKAKGREWDRVRLTGDWPSKKNESDPEKRDPKPLDDEAWRLMYVAVTRGRCAVDVDEVQPWLDLVGACAPEESQEDQEEQGEPLVLEVREKATEIVVDPEPVATAPKREKAAASVTGAKPKTGAERQRELVKRKKAAGMVQHADWYFPDELAAVKAFRATYRKAKGLVAPGDDA